ncbi:hypothetical protein D3C80_2215370 [compost metagenome]
MDEIQVISSKKKNGGHFGKKQSLILSLNTIQRGFVAQELKVFPEWPGDKVS